MAIVACCTAIPPLHGHAPYYVVITDSASEIALSQAVTGATDDWHETAGVGFDVVVGPCVDAPREPGVICIRSVPLSVQPPLIGLAHGKAIDGALLDIDVDSIQATCTVHHCDSKIVLRQTIAHEIGHALGLGHRNKAGSIMAPTSNLWPLRPSHDDARHVWQAFDWMK